VLKAENRLSTTYEFNKTRRLGKRVSSPLFDVFYLKVNSYEGPARIGVVVPNSFDRVAPKRNRVKRMFREVLRLGVKGIPNGYWVVVHPKRASTSKTHEELSSEVNKVLSKISFS
jgi:ribonuclease P protein component